MSSATEKTIPISANLLHLEAKVNDANFMHRIKGDCDGVGNQFCVVNDLGIARKRRTANVITLHFVT